MTNTPQTIDQAIIILSFIYQTDKEIFKIKFISHLVNLKSNKLLSISILIHFMIQTLLIKH